MGGWDDSPIKYVRAHAGAGTKAALAYLYWKETGDMSVWRGIAQVRLNSYINYISGRYTHTHIH